MPADPAPNYILVTIEPDDDIPAICGMIDVAPGPRVALVAPRGNRALQAPAGMARLLRHAAGAGKELALVSGQRSLRARARQSGMPAYASEAALQPVPPAPPPRLRLGWLQIPAPLRRLSGRARIIISFAAVLVFLALVAAYLLVPSAHVVVYPESEEITRTIRVTASTIRRDIDLSARSVPARPVTITLSLTLAMPTTGRVEEDEEDGEPLAVVAEQDLEALRALAQRAAEQQGFARLAEERQGTAAVYFETLSVALADERFSARPGEPADLLLLEVDAEVTASAVLDSDVQAVAEHALAEELDQDSMLLPGSVTAYQGFFVSYRSDTLTFEAQARGAVAPRIDQGQLKDDLAGKSPDAARDLLEERIPMAAPPEIDISPGWARSISRYGWRIDLELREPQP